MKANIELIVENRIEWINKRMVVTQLQKDYIKFMIMDAIGEALEQANEVESENVKALHKQNVNVSAFLFKIKDSDYELVDDVNYNSAVTKVQLKYPDAYWEFLAEFKHSR